MFAQPGHWPLNPSVHVSIIKPHNANVTLTSSASAQLRKGFDSAFFFHCLIYCCALTKLERQAHFLQHREIHPWILAVNCIKWSGYRLAYKPSSNYRTLQHGNPCRKPGSLDCSPFSYLTMISRLDTALSGGAVPQPFQIQIPSGSTSKA